ncbi:hypothetical protein F2Q69_00029420 [Brassica cretica]|uniref:Uncharacterized protein n=1 Tax=Brassica cretica TaxID=69181 RepID=A0A8S9S695_BRACR|nr:hypothetical protein F2Q69_00029420 [Brassica cretica]
MPRGLLLPNDENEHSVKKTNHEHFNTYLAQKKTLNDGICRQISWTSYFPYLNGNRQCEFRFPHSPFNPSSNGEIPYTLGHQNNQRRSGEFSILLPDRLKGEDQGLIAITEETSGPANPGTIERLKGEDQGLIAITEEISGPAKPGTRGQEVWLPDRLKIALSAKFSVKKSSAMPLT